MTSENEIEVFSTNEKRELIPVEGLLLANGIRSRKHFNEPYHVQVAMGGTDILRSHYLTVSPGDAAEAQKLVHDFLLTNPYDQGARHAPLQRP